MDTPLIIAGPCSVESKEQIELVAKCISNCGAQILRGGAFKPRTSPHSFQGLGEEGLCLLRDAAAKYNLQTISEVMDIPSIELVASYVDILQVGSRNMQNFSLLKALSQQSKPVLLKRGASATYHELLMAAEYIGPNVFLCERGIRTFETYTRNTLDLAAVPALKEQSNLPIIVDPSHGTGKASLVLPMARAALAAGADGLMIEVHPDPSRSISDPYQAISCAEFEAFMSSTINLV